MYPAWHGTAVSTISFDLSCDALTQSHCLGSKAGSSANAAGPHRLQRLQRPSPAPLHHPPAVAVAVLLADLLPPEPPAAAAATAAPAAAAPIAAPTLPPAGCCFCCSWLPLPLPLPPASISPACVAVRLRGRLALAPAPLPPLLPATAATVGGADAPGADAVAAAPALPVARGAGCNGPPVAVGVAVGSELLPLLPEGFLCAGRGPTNGQQPG